MINFFDIADPYSEIYVALVVIVSVITAHFIPSPAFSNDQHKFTSLDGVRAYCALFVMIAHTASWYTFARDGIWASPPSNLIMQLAQGSVTIFFLLSAFLFWGKFAETNKENNWLKFYVGRVFRLFPLYLFCIILVAFFAASTVPIADILKSLTLPNIIKTAVFLPGAATDLFALPRGTFITLIAPVWTLSYEWILYLTLPALIILYKRQFRNFGWAVGWLCMLWWLAPRNGNHPMISKLLIFPLGFLCAHLLASRWASQIKLICASPKASAIAAIILLAQVLLPSSETNVYLTANLFLYAIIFLIIAGGNTMWGILTWRASRKLGEMSFSIYLLHSLFLSLIFRGLFGLETVRFMTPMAHWLTIGAFMPLFILCVSLTYTFIERPPINYSQVAYERLTMIGVLFRKKLLRS